MGPAKFYANFGENAYEVELPQDLDISSIFKVADLYPFHGNLQVEFQDVECKSPPQVTSSKVGRIQGVIHVREVKTRAGNYFRFLVRWAGKIDYENSWISEEDFMKIDPEMCQAAKLTTRSEVSSF